MPASKIFSSASLATLTPGSIALIGVPRDENSSFLRGPAGAPAQIRQVLADGASTWYSRSGVNLENHALIYDLGNLEIGQGEQTVEQISAAVFYKEIAAKMLATK